MATRTPTRREEQPALDAEPDPTGSPADPPEAPEEGSGEPGEPVSTSSAKSLAWKLAEVMGELSAIPGEKLRHVEVETRSGGSYGYDYITEATLMEELRPRLALRHVAVLYSDEVIRNPADVEGSDDNLTVVRVSLTFVDGETGERETLTADGYGTDLGDKGANKAKTAALRYLLWKNFLFASPEDPETENVSRRSGGGRKSGAKDGPSISPKQRDMITRLASEIDSEENADPGRDSDGRRPQDAIHVRGGIDSLTGGREGTASKVIDVLIEAKKGLAGTPPETWAAAFSERLDAIMGPPREDGPLGPDSQPEESDDDRPEDEWSMSGGGYGG